MGNYLQIAAKRWPDSTVHGQGCFAVIHGTDVYLFEDEVQARNVRLGWDNASVVDLEPQYVPTVKQELGWE